MLHENNSPVRKTTKSTEDVECTAKCSTPQNKDKVKNVRDSTPGGSSAKRKRGRPRKNITPKHNDDSFIWEDHSLEGTLPDACTNPHLGTECATDETTPKRKVGRPPKGVKQKSEHNSGNDSGKNCSKIEKPDSHEIIEIENLNSEARGCLVSQCDTVPMVPGSSEIGVAKKRGRPKKVRNDALIDGFEGKSDTANNSRKTPVSRKEGQTNISDKKAFSGVGKPSISERKAKNSREHAEHSEAKKLLDEKLPSMSAELVSKPEMQETPTLKKRGRPRKLTSAEQSLPERSANLKTDIEPAPQHETPQKSLRTTAGHQSEVADSPATSKRHGQLATTGQYTPSDSLGSDRQSETKQQSATSLSNQRTPNPRKRARPKKLETDYILGKRLDLPEKQADINSLDILDNEGEDIPETGKDSDRVKPGSKRKRGRPKKVITEIFSDSEDDFEDDVSTVNISGTSVYTGSRTKRAVSRNTPTDINSSNGSSRKSRQATKRIRRDTSSLENSEGNDLEWEAESWASKKKKSQPAAKKVKKTSDGPFTCVHCSSVLKSKIKMSTHMLKEHFRSWKTSCPEGVLNISQVVKMYKKITCKDCHKSFRFASYYCTHLKWCGRENELAKCAECGSVVKAMWFHLHEKNHARKREALEKAGEQKIKEPVKHVNGKHKRRAAKKAMLTMQETWDDNQNEEPETSDNDEYKLEGKESSSEDEDEGEEDETLEVPETKPEKKTLRAIPLEQYPVRSSSWRHMYPGSHQFPPKPTVWQDAEEMTLKERKSVDSLVVFPLWLPSLTDWHSSQLSDSEADAYLPQTKVSNLFRIVEPCQKTNKTSKQRKNTKKTETSDIIEDLKFADSRKLSEGHTTFVGGPVWALDWAPHPTDQVSDQHLAVYVHRKFEHRTMFDFCGSGNSLIQLWNCGNLQNHREDSEQGPPPPKLEAAIACDRGTIQDLKWCPHGAYNTVTGRLGLLAAATSSGQICVYSIPMLDDIKKRNLKEPAVFKIDPTVILSQNITTEADSGCMCVSWHVSETDTKMAAGYMDGTISVWDLATTSRLLLSRDSHGLLMIWPIQSFWAHTGPVMSVLFGIQHPQIVMSASHDRNQKAWDLRDADQPLWVHARTKLHAMACTPYWPVSYVAGDDCYTLSTNCVYVLDCINAGLIRSMSGYNIGIPCVWDLSYSPWLHNLAVCDDVGTVVYTIMYPCAEHYRNKKDLNKLKVPLMTTEEISLFAIEEEDELQEKQNDELNSGTSPPSKCLEFTFPKYPKNKSGTVNAENLDISKPSRRSIHKVVHNPNASSYMWITFGGEAGLLFIRPINTQL